MFSGYQVLADDIYLIEFFLVVKMRREKSPLFSGRNHPEKLTTTKKAKV